MKKAQQSTANEPYLNRIDADVAAILMEEREQQGVFKKALLASLITLLILIWVPLPGWGGRLHAETREEEPIPRTHVTIKPKPRQPVAVSQLRERSDIRIPVPDLTPDQPEPEFNRESLSAPDLVNFDGAFDIQLPQSAPTPSGIDSIYDENLEGLERPIIIYRHLPAYPKLARQIRLSGYVTVEAILRADGTIDQVRVLKSIGQGKFGFEKAAIDSVKKWRFVPGKLKNRTVDVRLTLNIHFNMD